MRAHKMCHQSVAEIKQLKRADSSSRTVGPQALLALPLRERRADVDGPTR